MLISQKRPAVEIQYSRVVKKDGNKKAQDIIGRIFEPCASSWRGFGVIKESGLKIRKGYSNFDAQLKFGPRAAAPKERKGCICAAVLRGAKTPLDCGLFGGSCKPESPVGPCMVSSEGTCSAYYKYERAGWRG
jgi:hydrogenase expression/formation protein HypD